MPQRAVPTRRLPVLAALTLLLSAPPALAATEFTVDTLLDDPARSTCDPGVPVDCSLRGAVIAANALPPGEQVTILVPGEYFLPDEDGPGEDAGQTGDLDVHRDLTIRPVGDATPYISGNHLDDGLFDVHAGELTIVGLTVADSIPPADTHAIRVRSDAGLHLDAVVLYYNGNDHGGGGLRVDEDATATLERCEVVDNRGDEGAGILVLGGSLTVSSSYFHDNHAATDGGGIYAGSAFGGASVTVRHSFFYQNRADGNGAGIATDANSDVLVVDSFFYKNWAVYGSGGGIYAEGSTTVRRSSFFEDEADAGSAIRVQDTGGGQAHLDLSNSTVSEVRTGTTAISLSGAIAELSHVTMRGNDLADVELRDASHLVLRGSILTRGCDSVASTMDSGGYNLVGAFRPLCWDSAAEGDGEIALFELAEVDPPAHPSWDHLDPGVRTPAYEPLETSPAVDAVATGSCPADEQRGFARPAVACDIGSVERAPLPVELFSEGFEAGDLSPWSGSVP